MERDKTGAGVSESVGDDVLEIVGATVVVELGVNVTEVVDAGDGTSVEDWVSEAVGASVGDCVNLLRHQVQPPDQPLLRRHAQPLPQEEVGPAQRGLPS